MELKPGYCSILLRKRRAVTNHIKSVHAIAMCNVSELAAGTMLEASIPKNMRWIPKEMTVQYAKMAKGKLTGTCSFDPNLLKLGDVKIPFEIQDKSGDTVLRVSISFYISSRK